jgi:hypothetical protein
MAETRDNSILYAVVRVNLALVVNADKWPVFQDLTSDGCTPM